MIAALPGGIGYPAAYFNDIGSEGFWWSASETVHPDYAYVRYMGYERDDANWYYIDKSHLFSVRCVQDAL